MFLKSIKVNSKIQSKVKFKAKSNVKARAKLIATALTRAEAKALVWVRVRRKLRLQDRLWAQDKALVRVKTQPRFKGYEKFKVWSRIRKATKRRFISYRRKWFTRYRPSEQFQFFTSSSSRTVAYFSKKRRMTFRRRVVKSRFISNSLHYTRPSFYLTTPFKSQSFVWQPSILVDATSKISINYNLGQSEMQNFTCYGHSGLLVTVFAKILNEKTLTWLWLNEQRFGQINLTASLFQCNTNVVNKHLFFANNLSPHLTQPGAANLAADFEASRDEDSSDQRQLWKLLRSFRNTSDAKRLTLYARKLRTQISSIPRNLFFKAGIVRISSSLKRLDQLTHVSQVHPTLVSARGWVKLWSLLHTPTRRTFRFRPRKSSRRVEVGVFRQSQPVNSDTDFSDDQKGIVTDYQLLLRDSRFTRNVSTNSLLTKFLHLDTSLTTLIQTSKTKRYNPRLVATDIDNAAFSSRQSILSRTNLVPAPIFKYTLKRKLLRILSFHKFSLNVTLWYYNTLVRFIEACSGKKTFIKFNPFIENALAFEDLARCNLWHSRITAFQRLLGPKIFLKESLKILHIAIKFKDPTFLANWIKGMLYRMSFWKYRLLFRYLKYAMRYLFWLHFPRLGFKGLKLRLKGKISVAGNARTRTLLYKIGETGYSKFNNKVVSDYSIINTFTGVLGFKVWFFF